MDEVRRSTLLSTVFSTWVVLGLFVDGWAHNADRPESFWTPYHALLYSGFLAAAATYALERRRHRRDGVEPPVDRLTHAGFLLFAAAGVGDAAWHSVLGIEEDVAALLSPTHLALMLGGLLLIAAPLRRTDATPGPGRMTWREGAPDAVAIVLAVAVVAFFLQFLSPFHGVQLERYGAVADEVGQLVGVAGVLVTSVLLCGGLAFALARPRRLPPGSLAVVVAAPALLLSSQSGFAGIELVVPAILAGAVAELLERRGAGPRRILLAAPAVLWLGWFGVFQLRWGLGWPAEFWTGTTVLAVLSGWGLALLARPATAGAPGTVPDVVLSREEQQVPPGGRGAPAVAVGGS